MFRHNDVLAGPLVMAIAAVLLVANPAAADQADGWPRLRAIT
jgi:hypothetical protein